MDQAAEPVPAQNPEFCAQRGLIREKDQVNGSDKVFGTHTFSQPIVFTYQVLLALGPIRTSTLLSSQARSTFYGCRTSQLSRRREF
jgi:hypothetical protein